MFVLTGTLLNTTIIPALQQIPLSLDNDLPCTVFRFGSTTDNGIPFSCHFDICATTKTGNVLLRTWIITKNPRVVEIYDQFDDTNPFQLITLLSSQAERDAMKLLNLSPIRLVIIL